MFNNNINLEQVLGQLGFGVGLATPAQCHSCPAVFDNTFALNDKSRKIKTSNSKFLKKIKHFLWLYYCKNVNKLLHFYEFN